MGLGGIVAIVVVLAVLVSPFAVMGIALWRRHLVRRFRAGAVRLQGTVLESPVTTTQGGGVVPTGGGGVTFIPGAARIASRPVVAYPGPRGERLTAQVRYPASQIYVYGQPVDLLVDPRDPRDVRLAAADGGAGPRRMLIVSIAIAATLVALLVAVIVLIEVLVP